MAAPAPEGRIIPLPDPRVSQKGWTAPPTISFADWDKAIEVGTALRGLENKTDFSRAAILADATMRDPRINGTMSTRVGALMGTSLYFQPASERRKAQRIRDEVAGSSDGGVGLWEAMFPPAIQGEMSLWGNYLGIAVSELVWTTKADQWIPHLVPWHPQHLVWNAKEERFYIRTGEDKLERLPRVDREPRSDGRWVVWYPHSLVDGWRRALLRPLAMLYIARQWSYRDWSRYNEIHGMPTPVVKGPVGAKDEDAGTMLAAVANRGAEGAIFLPRGDTDQGSWETAFLEATSRSWDSFQAHIAKLDVDIAIAVLGQNLSTEVQGGSFAAAQVHEMVRIDKRREDAGLARCLREQVLTWWAAYNYGDPELAPRMAYAVDPPADEQAMANVLVRVGEAITVLQNTGADIDVPAILDEFAVPVMPQDEGDDDEPAVAVPVGEGALSPEDADIMTVNEARARKGLGPLTGADGAPDPDGNLTVADYVAKKSAARTVAPADPAAAEAMAGLKLALDDVIGLRRAPKKRPKRQTAAAAARAQRYALRVAANAREKARAAISGDVAELLEALKGADSLEEVKRRVVAKYKTLKGRDLARVVEKASMLAQMAGRVGALEDL
jgi:phage gp29-like protein